MIIKCGDTRIHLYNVIAHSVATKKTNGGGRDGLRERTKYAIFFNFNATDANGKELYRQLVAFDRKEYADLVCNIIDNLMENSHTTCINDVWCVVLDRKTGELIKQDRDDQTIYNDRLYFDEDQMICDIDKIIEMLGIADHVVM